MKRAILILWIFSFSNLFAQRVINREIPVKGDVPLTEGISIPKINKGYTLWLPENERVPPLLVLSPTTYINPDLFSIRKY